MKLKRTYALAAATAVLCALTIPLAMGQGARRANPRPHPNQSQQTSSVDLTDVGQLLANSRFSSGVQALCTNENLRATAERDPKAWLQSLGIELPSHYIVKIETAHISPTSVKPGLVTSINPEVTGCFPFPIHIRIHIVITIGPIVIVIDNNPGGGTKPGGGKTGGTHGGHKGSPPID